jgi:hypothetical protein
MTIMDMQRAVETAAKETVEGEARVVEHEKKIADAEAAYDAEPTDKNFSRLEKLKDWLARPKREVVRLRKYEEAKRFELKCAEKARDSTELEEKLFALRDRVLAYMPHLIEMVRLRHSLMGHRDALAKLNDEYITTWERSNELAVSVGSLGHEIRCPRPRDNETLLLARVLMGQEFGLDDAQRYLEPFEEPRWNDSARPVFEAIERLLDSANREPEEMKETGT